jgi:hypothetical protein
VHELGTFLGHFHPLWVHLPIGIFVLLGALEVLGLLGRARGFSWLPPFNRRQRALILAIAAAVSVVAASLGWLLARGGDYDAALLGSHRRLGLAAAAASLLLLAVQRVRWLYAPILAATLALVVLAGHAGGKITHGSDFLTSHMPAAVGRALGMVSAAAPAKPRAVDVDHAIAYADVVRPILQERCVSCHGATKSNGGLRLDTWELLAKGGKDGPVIRAGDPAASPLVGRIDLPVDDREHMPPRGKPQLAEEDLTLLEWWVGSGAPKDAALAALDPPASVQDIVQARLGGGAPPAPPVRSVVMAAAGVISGRLGVMIRPLTPDGPWLDVNARAAGRAFGDRELAQLSPIAAAIQWLDIGNTSVTDEGLVALEPMRSLRRLHLDQLKITDDGLARLSRLRSLEYLNLRATGVTDAGLASLRGMGHLRALYLWQTSVTPGAVRALADALVDKRKIARWGAEKADLERMIAQERFDGNLGESLRPAVAPMSATGGDKPAELAQHK